MACLLFFTLVGPVKNLVLLVWNLCSWRTGRTPRRCIAWCPGGPASCAWRAPCDHSTAWSTDRTLESLPPPPLFVQYQHPFQYQDNKLDIVPALNFLPHFIIQNGKRHDNRSTLFLSSICSCLKTKIRKKRNKALEWNGNEWRYTTIVEVSLCLDVDIWEWRNDKAGNKLSASWGNIHSENDTSTLPTYSVFRRARKIRPKDNIGLDFFH